MEARKPSEEELTRAYKEAAQRLKEAKKKLRDFAINGQADKLTVSLNYVQAMLDEFLANYDLKMVQYARLDEAAIKKAPESERDQMKLESELRKEGREAHMNLEKTILERTLHKLQRGVIPSNVDDEIQLIWRAHHYRQLAEERKNQPHEETWLDDEIKVTSFKKATPSSIPKQTKDEEKAPSRPQRQSGEWGAKPNKGIRRAMLGDRMINKPAAPAMPFREHRRPIIKHDYSKDIQALNDLIEDYKPPKKGFLLHKRKPEEDERITQIKNALHTSDEEKGFKAAVELINDYASTIGKSKPRHADKLILGLQSQIMTNKPTYKG